MPEVNWRYTRLALFCLALLVPAPVALAHRSTPPLPSAAWTTWAWQPWIVGSLILTAWLYLRGARVLWYTAGRQSGVGRRDVVAFWSGWCALGVALLSPEAVDLGGRHDPPVGAVAPRANPSLPVPAPQRVEADPERAGRLACRVPRPRHERRLSHRHYLCTRRGRACQNGVQLAGLNPA